MQTEGCRLFLVEPGLWQGGRPGLYPPQGVDVVVNVSDRPNEFVDRVPLAAVAHFPLLDHAYPGHAWLRFVTGFVRHCRAASRGALVHCDMGESRSSLVLLAYLMESRGWGLSEAVAFLTARNPFADPNHRFMAGLAEYERWLASLPPGT